MKHQMLHGKDQSDPIRPEPIWRGFQFDRDAWLLLGMGVCGLLLAPAFVLPFVDSGVSTFTTERYALCRTYLPAQLFFMIAPIAFMALTAHLLLFPARPRVSVPSLAVFGILTVLAIIHEVQLWRAPIETPRFAFWMLFRYNEIGLVAAGTAGYRNWKHPSLATAFAFNGFMLAWLFTVAFPWLTQVWQ
ncbi:MAG: hypothetical protein GY722_06180 [bacterium]|nr:hypothetical protein [bacterium]